MVMMIILVMITLIDQNIDFTLQFPSNFFKTINISKSTIKDRISCLIPPILFLLIMFQLKSFIDDFINIFLNLNSSKQSFINISTILTLFLCYFSQYPYDLFYLLIHLLPYCLHLFAFLNFILQLLLFIQDVIKSFEYSIEICKDLDC